MLMLQEQLLEDYMEDNENRDINIALLIDVDNIGWKYTESILSELSKYGKVTIRRMYGDWSQPRLKGWLSCASRYSLTPIMQPNNTPGKNASDIGLIIDAMDILYSGEVEGFCIVSSDGDFNKLATRIREAGMVVIGMGEKKTPESFRASCERFVFLDIIQNDINEDDSSSEDESSDDEDSDNLPATSSSSGTAPQISEAESEEQSTASTRTAIENTIIKMITDNNAIGKETGLGEIGSRLVKIYPDFDIRNYNYSKLSSYLKDFESLTVATRNKAVWVSLNGSSIQDVEKQIIEIFHRCHTNAMNIGKLKSELQKVNPNLNATIKKNGVTKFSVFLDKKVDCIHLEHGDKAVLTEASEPDAVAPKPASAEHKAKPAVPSVPAAPASSAPAQEPVKKTRMPIRTARKRVQKKKPAEQ